MKKLVIYGSKYGSTEEYARAIAKAIGCDAITAGDALADPYNLGSSDMLVIGTPVYYDRVHPDIERLLTEFSNVTNPPLASTLLPGRIIMDKLDDEDSKRTREFYGKIGIPLKDNDFFDIDSIKPFIEHLKIF